MKTRVRNFFLMAGLGVFLVAGVSACGGSEAKEVDKLADRACECKDKACAEKVLTDVGAFFKKNAKKKVSKKNAKKIQKGVTKLTKCMVEKGVPPMEIMKTIRAAK